MLIAAAARRRVKRPGPVTVMPPNVRLRSATLVRAPGKTLTQDLDDDDIADAFALGEAVAFTGLSARRFFGYKDYNNRDTFSAIVQKLFPHPEEPPFANRRRDGGVLGFNARASFSR